MLTCTKVSINNQINGSIRAKTSQSNRLISIWIILIELKGAV